MEPFLRWLYPAVDQGQLALAHHVVRKGAHLTVYATLAMLTLRALERGAGRERPLLRAAKALVLVGACAVLDEWHQSFTHHRTGSLQDSLIDVVGGAAALLLRVGGALLAAPRAAEK